MDQLNALLAGGSTYSLIWDTDRKVYRYTDLKTRRGGNVWPEVKKPVRYYIKRQEQK